MKIQKPEILRLSEVTALDVVTVSQIFGKGLKELFYIENPRYGKNSPESEEPLEIYIDQMRRKYKPILVYFPWSRHLVVSLPEDLYFKLRTARNRNLITETEQTNFRNLKVGIAGLSVGSSVLQALVISGGPKFMKLADFDVIEVSNLNRMKAGLADVGKNKAEVAAMSVWNLDPFADIEIWDKGLSADNISEFVSGNKKIDVFIDEMDNLAYKVLARKICREHRVPVVMATDNGDDVLLDIERFDLEPDRPLFHGSVDEKELENLESMDRMKWIQLSTKIVDPDDMTEDVQKSLLEMGRSISGVPQLGATGSVAGAVVSYVLRRISSGYTMPSGRYIVSLEDALMPDYHNSDSIRRRSEQTKVFKERIFGGR